MPRKDNVHIQIKREQKLEFSKLAKGRKQTQTKLFDDLLKLAKTKVLAPKVNEEGDTPGVIEAEGINKDEVIVAEIIPGHEAKDAVIIADIIN